eukprot:TRINITY_DN13730_c0_g1_i1.p1 TRINITY_DN13730_c0_g1~~TRINITY_DN13730_c0_g1_i1.p1  ORF type:complete len:112 (+),score=10.72 TRINITY_DN13730_c0_g1_i1:178-513(+)
MFSDPLNQTTVSVLFPEIREYRITNTLDSTTKSLYAKHASKDVNLRPEHNISAEELRSQKHQTFWSEDFAKKHVRDDFGGIFLAAMAFTLRQSLLASTSAKKNCIATKGGI